MIPVSGYFELDGSGMVTKMLWIICVKCCGINRIDEDCDPSETKVCGRCGAIIDSATQHNPYVVKIFDRIWFCACEECEKHFNFVDPNVQVIKLQLASLIETTDYTLPATTLPPPSPNFVDNSKFVLCVCK